VTQAGYLLLGLTVLVGVLAGVVAFALLKAGAAVRQASRGVAGTGENAFMQAALEEALAKLKIQERAMTARAEASERLSSEIIASMTSGLMVVGSEGEVRILNPAGRRLLGLPDADWKGHYRDVLAASPLAEVIAESLDGIEPIVRRSLPMNSKEGASHLGVTVSRIRDDHGALSGVICLFTDLSAVVELEEQLRLKDSLARLGELTAGLAHEFRNGLATIHGYSRLFDLDRLPPEYRQYVLGIRAEGDELGAIVTNFLNFARPADLTLAPVDMQLAVELGADDIRQEVRERQGELSIRGEFGMVLGDEILLRQAISNLCRNALEACIEAGITPQVVIEGSIDHALRQFRVTVADNGPGIDPSLGDRIFRPFFTTRARGTGLGLALVQKIVVTHNGRVTVSSGTAGGATFQVSLPLDPGSGPAA
jgi:two-component system, NtrC family, sensor histidine kinase HydH